MAKPNNARKLRSNQTNSEALLWSILRARQVCGLKFRRQHPIAPYFADFACVDEKLVVEIDGDCHDFTGEADKSRESYLRSKGWRVLRFSAEEVEGDTEDVAIAIAKFLGREFEFNPRKRTGSGKFAEEAKS